LERRPEPFQTTTWVFSGSTPVRYSAAVVLWKHEPWADEAQAWLIARDCSGVELLFQRLRYEGPPGLWYLILMVPSKILPYYPTIQVISFSIAVAGIFVFWRTSPFPPILKTLFPFTYFIFYQYAVVARSYVLLPLLIFLVGHYYPQRFRRVYLFTLLLCLLAYVSVFSALIAISTMLVHFLDLLKWWKELEGEERKRQMASLVAFGLFIYDPDGISALATDRFILCQELPL